MKTSVLDLALSAIVVFIASTYVSAQSFTRELKLDEGGSITIVNLTGRVEVRARPDSTSVQLIAASNSAVAETDLKIDAAGSLRIETLAAGGSKRIDLSLTVPERVRLKIETREGEIRVSGDVQSVEAKTDTGTIAADVPVEDLKYDFFWTASRPRYLSDIELKKVKEKSGGKFQLKGKYQNEPGSEGRGNEGKGSQETGDGRQESEPGEEASGDASGTVSEGKDKRKKERSTSVDLAFTTARGIVLLNIPPNEVSSDLRERPLTNAAKAIIRSGDIGLMDSIRRASPKYFGEYSRTLPPMRREPTLTTRALQADVPGDSVKQAVVRVTDMYNRSIADLTPSHFTVAENGAPRDNVRWAAHCARQSRSAARRLGQRRELCQLHS